MENVKRVEELAQKLIERSGAGLRLVHGGGIDYERKQDNRRTTSKLIDDGTGQRGTERSPMGTIGANLARSPTGQ
jgi:hypothetical protein